VIFRLNRSNFLEFKVSGCLDRPAMARFLLAFGRDAVANLPRRLRLSSLRERPASAPRHPSRYDDDPPSRATPARFPIWEAKRDEIPSAQKEAIRYPPSQVVGQFPPLPFETQTPHSAGPQQDHPTLHVCPPHRLPASTAGTPHAHLAAMTCQVPVVAQVRPPPQQMPPP
jgi:hypothetical protein